MDVLWLDFETFSECDLKKHGADIYSRHASTEALMLAWSINAGPTYLWDISSGAEMPRELVPFLYHHSGKIRAYNAPFEMAIIQNVLGIDINLTQWEDAQVLAFSLSFAGSLKTILGAIGLENKDDSGSRLIKLFSVPQRVTKNQPLTRHTRASRPDDWGVFCQYCIQDVVVLKQLWFWCMEYAPMNDDDWTLWRLDQKINTRGLPVDMLLVSAAIEAMESRKTILKAELQALADRNQVSKITPQPLAEWLGLPNFQKATKEKALETAEGDKALALKASLQLAQLSSASKWTAFDCRTDKTVNVIRDTLQFAGASRTMRWAGRGVQVHNMKWTSDNQLDDTARISLGIDVSMDQISRAVRGAICAPPGQLLVVSDLSGIESRLAGWVCECTRINQIFAEGKDVYKDLATHLFHVPYGQVTKKQRGLAKPAALGAQYRLGGHGLQAYAEGFGVELTKDEAKNQVRIYRDTYPEIPTFWYWIEGAIYAVVKGHKPNASGYGLVIYKDKEFLAIRLPSGRSLHYHKPHYELKPIPGYEFMGAKEQFTYGGLDNFHWSARINAHSGGLLENIIQAIARDVLALWISRANAAGLNIVGHVHDEIICLQKADEADRALEVLNLLAADPISWAPGLNLTAAGYIAQRYKKD